MNESNSREVQHSHDVHDTYNEKNDQVIAAAFIAL
jgi:hypothetical protein